VAQSSNARYLVGRTDTSLWVRSPLWTRQLFIEIHPLRTSLTWILVRKLQNSAISARRMGGGKYENLVSTLAQLPQKLVIQCQSSLLVVFMFVFIKIKVHRLISTRVTVLLFLIFSRFINRLRLSSHIFPPPQRLQRGAALFATFAPLRVEFFRILLMCLQGVSTLRAP